MASLYFSDSYQQARMRFLETAQRCGFTVTSHQHPLPGHDGQPIYTDIASKIPSGIRHVLMTTSGIHGVEGYAGSAIQSYAMQRTPSRLRDRVGVVHVHALNPYGFDRDRRVNEGNIDLSRNFIDWDKKPPADHPLSPAIQAALKTRPGLLQQGRIAYLLARHGMGAAKDALTRGQYTDPSGLYYGGNAPAWSNMLWHKIITETSAQADHLVHVDFHTGLGPHGHGEMIMMVDRKDPMFSRAKILWGDVTTPLDRSSTASPLNGSMCAAFNAAAPGTIVTTAALEFGTFPPLKVLRALATDHYSHLPQGNPAMQEKARHMMKHAFNPQASEWQEDVLCKGSHSLILAARGLVENRLFRSSTPRP